MASFTIHLLAALTFLGAAETGPQSGKAARKRRDTPLLTFLQAPQKIRYFVSRKQPANLTWVATDVCKMEIKCNGKKFEKVVVERVRGKTPWKCKTRTITQIINVSDFPRGVRNMTCHCKVWGTISERNETTIVEKAFLRRKFGKVDLDLVALPNTTVTLQCKPPGGSPQPNITWCKNGEPLFFRRGRRVRVNAKGDLVIKRLRTNDTGEYRCVAESIVARREGLVITLEVRGNVFIAGCNESQWPCAGQSTPGFNSSVNATSSCAILGESKDEPWDLITPLLIIILVLLALVLFVVAVKKRSSCSRRPPDLRSVPSTKREDDRDDADDGAVEELATKHTDLVRAGSQPNDELPELNAQVCNAEPSGACAASEISPVKLHGDIVVYVTKVEVQQSGGVTVVGDEANIHHHYSPQS